MAMVAVTATFNGTQDTLPVTWTGISASYGIQEGVSPTDGAGGIVVWYTARVTGGCTVNVSERFSGSVELVIYDK